MSEALIKVTLVFMIIAAAVTLFTEELLSSVISVGAVGFGGSIVSNILDLDEHMDSERLFEIIAEPIAAALDFSPQEIAGKSRQREREAVTALKPEFAIPHIIIDGTGGFELLLVRSRKGIWFSKECPNVTSALVMAGTEDQWHFYLRAVAAIAQVVRMEDFYNEWNRATNREKLRDFLISRFRTVNVNK